MFDLKVKMGLSPAGTRSSDKEIQDRSEFESTEKSYWDEKFMSTKSWFILIDILMFLSSIQGMIE